MIPFDLGRAQLKQYQVDMHDDRNDEIKADMQAIRRDIATIKSAASNAQKALTAASRALQQTKRELETPEAKRAFDVIFGNIFAEASMRIKEDMTDLPLLMGSDNV